MASLTETGHGPEPDPQGLLPSEYRHDWAVIPRDSLCQAVLVGGLLGAGVALSITGFVLENRTLWLALPIALALAWLQERALPWSETGLLEALRNCAGRS